jgi:hypothetical protein
MEIEYDPPKDEETRRGRGLPFELAKDLILLAKSGKHHIGPGHVRCGRVALRHPASFVRS